MLEQIAAVAIGRESVAMSRSTRPRIAASRKLIEQIVGRDEVVYGVNTGFGKLSDVRVAPDDLRQLQLNLVRSHACGIGEPLSEPEVRAMMLLRANVLALGFSGIRGEVIKLLCDMLNRRVHPVVPEKGSVGASGDLAPLAHLSLVLVGEGEAQAEGEREDRSWVPAAEALARAGLKPITLGPKEGLALINGTQPSAAVLALALADAEQLARAADIAAALTIDALRGSIHPFEARIHDARPFAGQRASAANIELLMRGSGINKSHEFCGKVQDAYSLRCAAQVHGATREALRFVRETVDVENNSATDNPMVFADSGEIVSCGNFHGAPIAIAADLLASAIVPLATISERRTDRLVDPTLSGLPAFLTRDGGLQSGFMMAQVTAAAVASELKALAHPAGVDTIPTSANKEDHVSMSMTAALKAERAVARAREVIAIEILCASQAIDLLAPLETSTLLKYVHALVRSRVPMLDRDRPSAPDIIAIAELIATRELERACDGRVK